jgi:regulator of cell morphogenesis and NO signaling
VADALRVRTSPPDRAPHIIERRTTVIDLSSRIADLVTDHPETARVLQRHRIDFCCKGERPLAAACAERGVDPSAIGAELEQAIEERHGGDEDLRSLSTSDLVARIVDRHHGYLRRNLPFLAPLAAKVARVHGERDPRLTRIDELVQGLCRELLPHLDHEEETLFPAIVSGAPQARDQLAAMWSEHETIGEQLRLMRELTADYSTPDWACRSYRTLFAELEHLETDVLTHVHLENHVLAPRVG